ncbi:MAG: alpha/beta hydrolase [Saezia sp.]
MKKNSFLKYAAPEGMQKTSKTRKIISLLLLFAILAFGYYIIPIKAQSAFFFPDDKNHGETPANQNLSFEEVAFASQDGTKLHGWFVPAQYGIKDSLGTVIVMHGNAANITDHWHFSKWLPQVGYNVFIFDYRGYGQSDKVTPTFKGVYEDSVSALDYVRTRPDVDPKKLLILGQSLGGTNAIATIGSSRTAGQPKNGICGMVIDSTFYSPSEIANDKFPYAGLLMNNDYSAERYVQSLAPIPLLFIHGSADVLIPMKHSERLFALANEPKELVIAEGIEHAMALSDYASLTNHYQNKVRAFFANAIQNCND